MRQGAHWTARSLLKHLGPSSSFPMFARDTPQNAGFCCQMTQRINQLLLIRKTNLALAFPRSQDHPSHTAWSSAADSTSQVLSHGHALRAKLTAILPCCTGKGGEHIQSLMAKGHMFLCNIHVGNTCNPFTLFTVLLSIHRRL